jgi:ankyrin repeat protein
MKVIITTIAAVLLVGCANLPRSTPVSTQLHFAATKGNIEAVKRSIADGANVNAKEGLPKGTPLHKAAMFGHKEIVELLIASGVDVNAIVSGLMFKGKTPLDLAIIYSNDLRAKLNSKRQMKFIEIADLLRKHGGKTGEELKAEGK